jgi:polar amino acid transport system substrate-binding protein
MIAQVQDVRVRVPRRQAMSGMGKKRRSSSGATAAALLALAVVAGCSSSGGGGNAGPSTPSGSLTETKDAALAAAVPAALRSKGNITIASDVSYPPDEFFASDNRTIIGMDVDLAHAIGQVLGLQFNFTNVTFDSIIPNLGSRYDLGMSSFTDNKKRERQVNMVTYFSAGTSFMVKTSGSLAITGLDSLCGHNVAVEKGTTQLDDVTAQSPKCRMAGKKAIGIQPYPDESGVNLALSTGRADVVLADTTVNNYLVKKANGQFKITGPTYGTAPYGIAVSKGAKYQGFDQAILNALKKTMTDGVYQRILAKWGIQEGAISNPVINGAVS